MQENYTIFFLKITFAYSTGISYAIRYPLPATRYPIGPPMLSVVLLRVLHPNHLKRIHFFFLVRTIYFHVVFCESCHHIALFL